MKRVYAEVSKEEHQNLRLACLKKQISMRDFIKDAVLKFIESCQIEEKQKKENKK